MKTIVQHIAVCISILAFAWLSACKQKHICPAYQSAFYLDPKIAEEEFGYFDKDSMPKMEETVRKTDVLLVLRLGKKKIDKRMAVVPMITIFPEQADSALAMADSLGGADSTMTEDEVVDELQQDSTMAEDGQEAENLDMDTETEPEDKPRRKKSDEPDDVIIDEDIPKPLAEEPKKVKKVDPKDPELSDPGLKAEFEESFEDDFGDVPKEEDPNEPPPPEPIEPKGKAPKKGPKKAEPKADEDTPKQEAEDDKF